MDKKIKKQTEGETAPTDEYYDAMIKAKQAAGLSSEQATEVTERQRQTDIGLGIVIAEEA